MRSQGWDRETLRRLPDIDDGYWYVQSASINQLLADVPFVAGESLLDVGSNTCWASNRFARHGLKVIALDIATAEMQGLYSADYFIQDGTSYFERVLGSMYDMPIASGSLDYVYCCEVLHHNDTESLRRTFEECFRVLRPGGKVLVVNETLKTGHDPVGRAHRGGRPVRRLRARSLGVALPGRGDPGRLLDAAAGAVIPLVLPRRLRQRIPRGSEIGGHASGMSSRLNRSAAGCT